MVYDSRPMSGARAGGGIAIGVAGFALLLWADQTGLAYTALIGSLALLCFGTGLSLNQQIGIALVAGVGLGIWPDSHVEDVRVVGRLFIAMLKMLIAPMILLSIVSGIAGMGRARDLGTLGARTIGLYLLSMALAVATGLVAVNLFEPGAGSTLVESEFFRGSIPSRVADIDMNLTEFLSRTLFQALANPLASISEGRILPIVLFAVLLGLALLQAGPSARPLVDVLAAANRAVLRIIGWFIRLAPIGIFALIGHLVATIGFAELARHLGGFAMVVILATGVHAALTLPLIARIFGGLRPAELFRGIREALIVAFTTSSSAATLPVTTRCVEQNLGVRPHVSSFVLPLGATVNMDGTALYEAIAAVFVANVYGIELGLGSQLVVFVVAMLTAVGAPGIPSAGMVTMVVVLEAVGLPVEAVGILLTIDRFLDTFRTMVNVEGDAVVAACVEPRRPVP